jgi:acetyltransferase
MIYSIARYPVHLIDVVQIAGGSRVTIRPMLPQDMEPQQAFFRKLSSASRYFRFMSPLSELPEALSERLTNVDYRRHLALIAEVFDQAGRETMIAEARYIVDERDPKMCEFAIAVADEWHSHGIARALLARLESQAAASGIRRMAADTLVENSAMRRLATRAGYTIKAVPQDYEAVRLEKVLASPASTPSDRLAA